MTILLLLLILAAILAPDIVGGLLVLAVQLGLVLAGVLLVVGLFSLI
jgi:hypothetical protein